MNLEDKVLSAVLKDKQVHLLLQADVATMLKTHGDIWEFIRNYYEQNMSVPPVSIVVENFRDFEPIKDVGSTRHHLDELRSDFMQDKIKSILRMAAQEIQDNKTTDALNTLVNQTAELKKVTADIRDLDVTDVDDALIYFQKMKEMQEAGMHGIYTGIKGFDQYLPSGISPGQFGVLLAYPAIGKSWMSLYFAVSAWKNGKSPLIVSLEMTETEVRNRVFAIIGNGLWSHRKLTSGEVDIDMFRGWAKKTFENMPPLHIISNDGLGEITPSVVRGKINQYSPSIVFIDYLNLMNSNFRTENEVVKMKNLSRELKLLAISEEIPIVAISSATPDDVTNMNSVPTLGQTSWSRQISYDADWLLALGRQANSDIIECAYRKNRNGFLGDFLVQVDFDRGIFKDRAFDDDL